MQAPCSSIPPDPGPGQGQQQTSAQQEVVGQQSQEQWRKMNTVFTNAKAGMAGVDKQHVQKVVYEMSKVSPKLNAASSYQRSTCIINRGMLDDLLLPQNSPHFKNEQRKQKQTDERIAKMKQRTQSISQAELAGLTGYCLQHAFLCKLGAHDSRHGRLICILTTALRAFQEVLVSYVCSRWDVQGLRKYPEPLWLMLDFT